MHMAINYNEKMGIRFFNKLPFLGEFLKIFNEQNLDN
jgi:hypothetical protein